MPGPVGCASVVGTECCESGARKRAERSQIGPEAAGLGKAAPGPEPEAAMEVPTAECVTPYLSAIPPYPLPKEREHPRQTIGQPEALGPFERCSPGLPLLGERVG